MTKREEWVKRKNQGPTKLSGILTAVTKPVFGKLGYAEGKIKANWSEIVGSEIAPYAIPRKIYFQRGQKGDGVLYIDVLDSYAIKIQHMEPIIIEKIAVYFGYRVISKLKIFQKNI